VLQYINITTTFVHPYIAHQPREELPGNYLSEPALWFRNQFEQTTVHARHRTVEHFKKFNAPIIRFRFTVRELSFLQILTRTIKNYFSEHELHF